ncbi:1,2-phenylacetyl-CoA epoxidase subunit PaaC [Egicoccus halophilus]|uniref:Phenylacetic acid degradation protein n=1 Tax=Egicoccus halophilus TaxID=1670830 RepID=A0A8J3AD49_9ACTN|nr:1,2-phenylacetyl-CoA epoxidase subunit PaaC [Egicoccus halophilus]GGI09471.1 phenylacetic acid degradation protein [Egicoccus halophilus]
MSSVLTGPDLALPDLHTPRAQVLLAVADDNLVTGHRSSHWTGVAPSLEEDLAFSTIAQDGISHADLWYRVLLQGAGFDGDLRAGVDALGLGRDADGYRHAVVCERPPRDFAFTLARHWVHVHVEAARLQALSGSNDAEVAALAIKLAHELRYHREHADHWFARLTGDDGARGRFADALAVVLPESFGLFEPAPGEHEAVADGVFPGGHPGLRPVWLESAAPVLVTAGLGDLVPADDAQAPAEAAGGRAGRHTADFTDDVWPEMTALYRADPGARW